LWIRNWRTHRVESKQIQLPADASTQFLNLTLDKRVGLALKQNTTAQIAILTAAQSEQDKKHRAGGSVAAGERSNFG